MTADKEKRRRVRFNAAQRLARCQRQIAGRLRKIDKLRDEIDEHVAERVALLLSMREDR